MLPIRARAAAPQLAATADASMLEQTTAAVAAVTGASSAYLERVTHEPDVVEVLAATGPLAPPLGFGPPSAGRNGGAYRLPLRLDDRLIGNIVALDVPPAVVLDASAPGQLELLGCVGALALRNLLLARELDTMNAQTAERRFRLTSGIVQYMKEVLGAASEYVQLLDTESDLSERQQQYIHGSRRNLDAGLRLMSELLELSRVETGRVALEYELTDMAAVVRGITRDFELLEGTSGIQFRTEVESPLMRSYTDLDLLRRILDALLANAVRYSPATGVVTVRAQLRPGRRANDPGSWVCIAVTDDGPGVRESEQVFEEVARAETITGARGFRLAISRRLARLLGGDLTLTTDEGRGSTFTLWLPVHTTPPAAGPPAPALPL